MAGFRRGFKGGVSDPCGSGGLPDRSCQTGEGWVKTRMMNDSLREAGRGLLDMIYPRGCFACEAGIPHGAPRSGPEAWLCRDCQDTMLPIQAPYCSVCGEPFGGAMDAPFLCWNCAGRRLAFDFAVSAHEAGGALREMIHSFKYHRQLAMRAPLADFMLPVFEDPRLAAEDLSGWLLVPVPLHPFRWVWRGYNQSRELCRMLSRLKGIRVVSALRRARVTRSQAGLERKRRLDNLKGVFQMRWPAPDLRGKNVLLVDDVLTTGATTHECAKVLKTRAGVEKVVVITAARG